MIVNPSNQSENHMNMSDINDEITQQTAPRVTREEIEANIVDEFYFTADAAASTLLEEGIDPPVHPVLSRLTFYVLLLKNGFAVTGESCCVSAENFSATIGRQLAREAAIEKIWPLMGYALADKLLQQQQGQ